MQGYAFSGDLTAEPNTDCHLTQVVGGSEAQISRESTEVLADGRITINLDSKISRVWTALIDANSESDPANKPPLESVEPEQFELFLNVLIMVVGSRGDVQPFVALGNGLQKHGHRVRIATHSVFKEFVQSAGLEFYSIGGDPAQLMAYMVKNPGLIPDMRTLRQGEIRQKRHMVDEMMRGCWAACIEPDESGASFVANAIIANPPSFAHVHCAQALGIPLHMVFTMPWSPTKSFPHPLANIRNSTTDERTANRLSFGLVNTLTWQGLGDVINNFRSETLGLEEVATTEGPFLLETLKIPYSYCWSSALVPRPHDWPEHIDVTGFTFRSPPPYEPPTELDAFLRSGSPPLYIGFGSIVVDDPDSLLRTVLEAVRLSNVRCIVSKGWSSLDTKDVPDNVIFVGDCPHEWLFEQVFAVVHHGGAGTTAAGLLAGKPTVVVPFFGDQPFWGDMIAKVGAGPPPLPYKTLTADDLCAAIQFCKVEETVMAAQEVAQKMKSEDGVEGVIASFHRHLQPERLRCDVIPTLPAIFECKTNRSLKRSSLARRKVRLSGIAAEALERSGRIKCKMLRSYKPHPFTIENRRWDMFTALTSATIGISYGLLSTTNDIWYAPYKMSKKTSRPVQRINDSESVSSSEVFDPKIDHGKVAGKYIGTSAVQLPKLLGVLAKGVVVDIPVAVTEGLRATPKLHGEAVQDHGPITDWKSGIKVASKDFITGTGQGLTDLFVQPYIGAKERGVGGFTAGVAKGALGTVTKTSSAVLGLYAHTSQGIWRSVYAASHSSAQKDFMVAAYRTTQDAYSAEDIQSTDAIILEAWDKLQHAVW